MIDMSVNLPSWAYNEGYRLEGDLGTVGDLYLYKNGSVVQVWRYPKRVPNIFEMEEAIKEFEHAV